MAPGAAKEPGILNQMNGGFSEKILCNDYQMYLIMRNSAVASYKKHGPGHHSW